MPGPVNAVAESLASQADLEVRIVRPGRGPALTTFDACEKAIRYTQSFLRGTCARRGVKKGKTLKQICELTRRRMDPACGACPIYGHCMPFNVSRAYDEARGIKHPRVRTVKRDREMSKAIA